MHGTMKESKKKKQTNKTTRVEKNWRKSEELE